MMPIETSRAIDEVEADFLYDVTEVTVALFYLLQGMEITSRIYVQDPDDHKGAQLAGPKLSRLRTFPAVSTTGPDMLGPSGEAVQLAFKGWVADVFATWERSRSKTRELLGNKGVRPTVDCMGDFRLIRNDLIHSGFATEEYSGKCKVLKWFKPGERMILATDHVFDLLNQMNLITLPAQLNGPTERRIVSWMLAPDTIKPTSLEKKGIRIVSFRFDVDNDGLEASQRYMMSIVFSDGVFGQGEVEVPVEPEKFLGGYIDRDGNIAFPGRHVLGAGKLYQACYGYLEGDRKIGSGILGPDVRYTTDSRVLS